MILLYGGGGEPGAGEIPMDLFRKQAPDLLLNFIRDMLMTAMADY